MEEMKDFMPEVETIQLADEQMRQMILAIKKTRAEKHLSYQAIVDGCEENGDYVSMSSVRRVCADGSENQKFRYEATLRPIARFVLGLDNPVPPAAAADHDGPAANELLRVVVSIKEDAISDMKRSLEDKKNELTRTRNEYESRLEEKNRIVASQQEEIKSIRDGNKKRNVAIVVLSILLLISMTFTIAYMAWDLSHPMHGLIQWEASSVEG